MGDSTSAYYDALEDLTRLCARLGVPLVELYSKEHNELTARDNGFESHAAMVEHNRKDYEEHRLRREKEDAELRILYEENRQRITEILDREGIEYSLLKGGLTYGLTIHFAQRKK